MKVLALFLLLLVPLFLPGGSVADSLPDTPPSCRVFLDGEEVSAVYETAICHQRFWTENPALSRTPVAVAVHDGPCRAEIILADREEENGLSRWSLEPVYGGWNLVIAKNAEDRNSRFAVQFYSGDFKTYRLSASDVFTMNFYECGTDVIPQQ